MKTWLLLICLLLTSMLYAAEEAAWQAWRDGQAVLIMRHTLAPGTGDPANFTLGDCTTQRNLNAVGQQQATAWGQRLRQQYQGDIQLFSSQWCRCLETASLMQLGDVTPLPLLNSFFAGRGDGDKQTTALVQHFSAAQLAQPTLLVTHQVNFTALTGIFPRSGEAAILALPLTQPAAVLARINTP